MPRALLSVSDKTGLVSFAERLVAAGYELISTGGTFAELDGAGLPVTKVGDVTGFPEILEGRVKTLHPMIHGGILAKRTDAHQAELAAHEIIPIDLVIVNLYPFEQTVAKAGVSDAEAFEQIDIGGPTMVRAAAKNHSAVLVVVSPADYERVATALEAGAVDGAFRRELARKAFAHTAGYDAAIVRYFDREESLPDSLHFSLERRAVLRYGENPHQQGARYAERGVSSWWDGVTQHKGVALSYLNVFDAEAAWQLVHEFSAPACVVVKHANPCGVAVASDSASAYEQAFACDPKSAFGGIVALNRAVDDATAEAIMGNAKADVLIATGFTPEALTRLTDKRASMRVLEAPSPQTPGLELRRIAGGFLVQTPDTINRNRDAWQVVTDRAPTDAEWQDLELAWVVCAYTKSNAIVLVKDAQAVGIGAGQQSRVDAAEIAARKAMGRAASGACASDAFYPFRDGLDMAASAGVTAVIQPGGSVRDPEVIAAANEHGMAMVLTGERHFRH
jgi:phosphoribosylaminoimidazolecarboxamide formyltransferase/IMP cyclohydrolase